MTRRLVALGFGAAVALAALVPAPSPALVAVRGQQPAPALHAFEPPEMTPVVQKRLAVSPAVAPAPQVDGTSDRNAAAAAAAAALPLAKGSPSWRNVGPNNIVTPSDYSQSGEGFAAVSGNATALAVDPADKTGNTIYQGNYGGLWKSVDGGTSWKNVTDGYVSRTPIGAIAIDSRDHNNVYIGTGVAFLSADFGGAGVYASHDAGKTWTRAARNVRGYGVITMTIAGGAVFAGTTDGLFRSVDKGASWTDVALPTNAAHTGRGPEPYGTWVTALVVKPGTTQEVTAAVGFPAGSYKGFSVGNGLYRSTTQGAPGSWKYLPGSTGLQSSVSSSTNYLGRISLAYGTSPDQPDVLWALVGDAGLLVGDGSKGLPTADVPLVGSASNLNGAFRSGDDGATWTVKGDVSSFAAAPNSTIATLTALGYGPGVQAWYNNWIQVDPRNPDRAFVGLEEVYETTENANGAAGQASWQVIERYADLCGFLTYTQGVTNGASCPSGTPLYGGVSTHPDQHSNALLATAGGHTRLYTGNDGGVFRQDAHAVAPTNGVPSLGDDFDNDGWVAVNTPKSTLAYHAARLPDGSTVAGLQDNGTTRTFPAGNSIGICGGDGFDVGATPSPLVFYCSYVGDKMYVTKDGGHSVTDIDPDLTGAAFSAPFSVDPTDPNHLLAAGQNVKVDPVGPDVQVVKDPALGTVVSDGWIQVFDAGTSSSGAAFSASATALLGPASYVGFCGTCQSLSGPAKDRALIATNVKPGCTATKVTSACWHKAAGVGLPKEQINKIAIDPSDTSTIYVAVSPGSGHLDPSTSSTPRVLVSHDRGDHFTDLSGNLPQSGANSVVVRSGRLYAATDDGVFVSSVKGLRWQRFGSLPKVAVTDLRLDGSGRYLTAATYGRGAFEADLRAKTVTVPATPGRGATGAPAEPGGRLAATGGSAAVALVGLLLVLPVLVRRRRRRSVTT